MVAAAIPEDVGALVDGAVACGAHELDARLRRAARAMQAIDWQTGRLLRLVADLRLFRWLGFPSFFRYVRERLGLPLRKAQVLIALERKTWQAPALGDAYRRGELSWVRALALAPIVADRTTAAWVERAGQVTVRRLHDEVGWALTELEMALPFSWPVPPPMGGPGDGRHGQPANMCAQTVGGTERCDQLRRSGLGRHAPPGDDPRLWPPTRAGVAGIDAAARSRASRMGLPAEAPGSDLRA